jgi:hypothetical protein
VDRRPSFVGAALSCAALLGVAPAVAQVPAANRLVAARAALSRAKLDSAEFLLRSVLDTGSTITVNERAEAWLLLGVARYYEGNDSGVVAAFRNALTLEPRLVASRLAEVDSALGNVLDAQRRALAVAGVAASAFRIDTIDVVNCVPACPKGVTHPRLRAFPSLDLNPSDYDPSMAPRDARLVVRYMVDTAGRVDTMSIRIISNNFPLGSFFQPFQTAYLRALAGARFDPARRGDRPVAVILEGVARVDIRHGWQVHGVPMRHN